MTRRRDKLLGRFRSKPAEPRARPRRRGPAGPDELYEYWTQPRPEGHGPAAELAYVDRSAALLAAFPPWLADHEKDLPILEIGSGAGRNLAYLVRHGFTDVTGVEINPHAVQLMRTTYPEDLTGVQQHVGRAEDLLPSMPDDGYRLVFTMGTLQHIHPSKIDGLAREMVRVGSTVLAVEGPPVHRRRRFAHDYEAIFGRAGASLKRTSRLPKRLLSGDPVSRYTAWTFTRMDSLATLHEFWTQPAPPGNTPSMFVKPLGRSAALTELVSDLPGHARILEVGCNVGRNLAYLYDHGYPNVTGIEISPHAVDQLRLTYPQLADRPIHVGPAGEVLPTLPDQAFDLVFTMAVLEHIHPDESRIFDEMVRVSRDVLAIEPKGKVSHRHFPHDIPTVFTSRGLELVSSTWMGEFDHLDVGKAMHPYTAYRFAPPG